MNGRLALARSKKEGLAANAGPHGGFGAAENAQEKTGKTVPVPTRKSVSADCPALDALRLLHPQRPSVP
ncbi:MAG TPA: hypothetical protein VMV69_17080, partial [Pirellulales bacterium]|nr:hypothetical protein [Pirellulales bacterium]